ncbi:hypothetical protein JCGZ_21443 [Jatropha curcas]|uniref:E2 ubiquitin-conjugating enzyme n=2 Tax=Jatropha curcas TaxID=180498 RepID=A0A067JB29_JATCU|nr:hypothetical protein JCGZ_21443 [Jatropha curcas]
MDILSSDSDWESDSGSELDFLYSGQAHCILSSLEESLGKIDDFLSFERGFVHGDIVCSAVDPSGQMGRVVNVKMSVDLENVNGKIIKDVDSKDLLKIRSISLGDYVVHGPWIGRAEKILDNVTIIFDDGTKCEVTAPDKEKVLPVFPNMLEDSVYPYYPGQKVQVRLSGASKSSRWLCGSWKENQDIGTVSSVKAGLVYVDWIACALVGCESSLPAPQHLQAAKNLTLLPCFSHEGWQLGDWCMLSDCKGVKEQMVFDESNLELSNEHDKIGKGSKRQSSCSNFNEIFVIVKTKTRVDVLWQDGDSSLGLDSQSLVPVNVVNAYEFWPGQFVVEKSACDDQHVSGNQRWGVVSAVDAKEHTVRVNWKSTTVNQATDVQANQMEETLGAYELVEHPDYSYCYGDIVFRNVDQADKHHLSRGMSMGDTESKDCNRHHIHNGYLSCIGYVTGFIDGVVEVVWASGVKTKVEPSDIFRIDKYGNSVTNSAMNEQNIDEMNEEKEMIDLDKQSSSLKGKDLLNSNSKNESKTCPWKSSSFFLPQSTVGFFKGIAASIFESFGSTSLSGPLPYDSISKDDNQSETPEEKGIPENCKLCTEMQPVIPGEMQRSEITSLKWEVNLFQDNKEFPPSPESKSVGQFRQFEMVNDCSDHQFIEGAGKGLFSIYEVKRSWLKKVQQEWSTLEKDLPESIYVRIYEERMDLLRAAIVGAPGTPYHDGVFFFDIYFPPEYPLEPPLVYYHSGGLRVNPNLYESGKICLSLLNTWTGTGTEVWNPESSNILQVLLSLQALVLNEKPYFNEAGYDKQIGRAEGEKNSVSYNENAFLMTWKSMLYLLRRPPKHFEALMEEHLQQRSQNILLACKAYMEGAPVACLTGSGQMEHRCERGSSTGFKLMLAKIFPKLVEAFSAHGIDCSQFAELAH